MTALSDPDPSEKLEAVETVIPPELRRGRFKAPDALIASLMEDAPPIFGVSVVGQSTVTTNVLDLLRRGGLTTPST